MRKWGFACGGVGPASELRAVSSASSFSSGSPFRPERGYLICCLERTGSTLLAKALSATNVAGRPIEYFNPAMQEKPRLRQILGDLWLPDGMDNVLRAGTTPNSVFGAKLHWNHLRFLGMILQGGWDRTRPKMLDVLRTALPKQLSEAEAAELLNPRFGNLEPQGTAIKFLYSRISPLRFIWLRRRDMLGRAISNYRAAKSGVWYLNPDGTAPQGGAPVPTEYDHGEIHCYHQLGLYQEKSWEMIFNCFGITPHLVMYEDLIANYEDTVRGVLRFLDLDGEGVVIPSPPSGRQADELSAEWERIYRARDGSIPQD